VCNAWTLAIYALTLLIFGNFVTIMDLIVCDDDIFVLYCMLCILQLYCIPIYIFLCIAVYKYQKISVFFRPVRNISGAYYRCLVAHYVLVAHIAICATHKTLMAHMLYAPPIFNICMAHIDMRHQ
jgi:hypothetical protein